MSATKELLEILTFSAGYNTAVVILGTMGLGVAAGLIGTFTVLRQRALIGDALAHSTLPGLCAAFFFGPMLGAESRSLPILLLGATCSGVLGIATVQALTQWTRLTQDAAIGAVLSVFFGAGVVGLSAVQQAQTGNEGGLQHFIFGQTAAMTAGDAYLTGAVAAMALLTCLLFAKEFRLVCFDSAFTASLGWSITLIDFVMMALVVSVTVIGLQIVGILLIVALMIIPPAAARLWTDSIVPMMYISAGVGGLSAYIGASLSAFLPNLPAGAVIVLTAGAIFGVSFFCAPRRGLIPRLLSRYTHSPKGAANATSR